MLAVFRKALLNKIIAAVRRLRHPSFDTDFYLETYADLRAADLDPFEHFVTYGRSERRYGNKNALMTDVAKIKESGLFDFSYYANLFPEAAASGQDLVYHYLTIGLGRPNTFFDPDFYLAYHPDARKSLRPPFVHYVERINAGRTTYPNSGSIPRITKPWSPSAQERKNFNARYYRLKYPDIAQANINPIDHYIKHGRSEGRIAQVDYDKYIKPGKARFDRSKPTVLVCCHEASFTGAPIVGLHLAKHFTKSSNIVFWLGASGPLLEQFETLCSSYVIGYPELAESVFLVERLIDTIGISFAVMNSVVTWPNLLPFYKNNIPIVLLVHEFAEYSLPKGSVSKLLALSNNTIFPAELLRESGFRECDEFLSGQRPQCSSIRNQGLCISENRQDAAEDLTVDEIRKLIGIREPGAKPLIVLGCGWVQIRKGVDLFVETARVLKTTYDIDFRFVWVGGGFLPETDLHFSIWLNDQIRRLDIQDRCFFFEQQKTLEVFIGYADIFFLSSRLDPFPNVVIEALTAGKPVICFDKATGYADYIRQNELCGEVVPYIDTLAAARKIADIARHREQYRAAAEINRTFAQKNLGFAAYADYVYEKGLEAIEDKRDEDGQYEALCNAELFDEEFFLSGCPNLSPDVHPYWSESETDLLRIYISLSRKKVHLAKSRPGFNDRSYFFQEQSGNETVPPLLHALERGKPTVTHRVIRIPHVLRDSQGTPVVPSRSIALHVHSFHKELARELVEALAECEVACDVFITAESEEGGERLRAALRERELSGFFVMTAPTGGEDLRALIVGLREVLGKYDIIGHLHDEKTWLVRRDAAYDVRSALKQHFFSGTTCGSVIKIFDEDPSMGLLFPERARIPSWTTNLALAKELMAKVDPSRQLLSQPEFPVDRIFWARSAVLKPLFDLRLDWEDFFEQANTPVSMSHLIAGLLPAVCEISNHNWATVYVAPKPRCC